jgi:hypothetical protein
MPGGAGGDWELSPACRKIKQELGKQSINTVRAQVPTRWGGRGGWGKGAPPTHTQASHAPFASLETSCRSFSCACVCCLCQALTAFERMMADPVV